MSETHGITVDPKQYGGRPCIRGMRISVKDVLGLLAAGADRKEILDDYPYLENGDITAALEYALNQTDHPVGHPYQIIDDECRTDPLVGIGSVIKGGRYNAPRILGTLYNSESVITALHEIDALFGAERIRFPEIPAGAGLQVVNRIHTSPSKPSKVANPSTGSRSERSEFTGASVSA